MNKRHISFISNLVIIIISLLNQLICQNKFIYDIYQCSKHYYIDQNSSDMKCLSCNEICGKCIKPQECLTCTYGKLNQDQCVNKKKDCPSKYYYVNDQNECVKCKTDFCQACTQNNICYQCIQNFYLSGKNTCELKQDLDESILDTLEVSCPVGEEEKYGQCIQKNVCSSYFQFQYNKISEDTLDMVELEDRDLLILINKQSVQVYSYLFQNIYSEILSLSEDNEEIIVAGTKTKNYLIILTNKLFYLYDLKSFQYINKQILNINHQYLHKKLKFLYSDQQSDIIYYLSYLQNLYQLRIIHFEISTNPSSLNIIGDQIIFQKNNLQLNSFEFIFLDKIVIATTNEKVLIINLNIINTESNIIDVQFDVQFSQFISQQISWKNNQKGLFFYVMRQTESKVSILKIDYNFQKNEVTNVSEQFVEWIQEDKLSKLYKLYQNNNLQKVNDKVFLKSQISYKISEQYSNQAEMFLGFADVDYFFDKLNLQYFYYEQISINFWKNLETIQPYLFQSQEDQDTLIMIVAYNGLIELFEMNNRSNQLPKEKEQKIIYENNNINVQYQFYSIGKTNVIVKIKTQIFKLILKEINSDKVYYTRSIYYPNQIRDVYFSKGNIYQVVVPQYLTDINYIKYSFILLNYKDNRYFEVVQTIQSYYGHITILAKSIIQFIESDSQFITIEDDSFCSYEEQILYVISKRGIYIIEFHSLKLRLFVPLLYYFVRNQNILMSIMNNIQINQNAEGFINNFELVLIKCYQGKVVILKQLDTFNEWKFSQDLSLYRITFNPFIQSMIIIKYQNDQLKIIEKAYIDDFVIQFDLQQGKAIKSFSFLSDTQFGYITNENNLTAVKITLRKDETGRWIIFNNSEFTSDQIYNCKHIDYSQFSICFKNQDEEQHLFLFDWQELKIVTNNVDKNESQPIEYLTISYRSGDFYFEEAEISQISEKETKILIIFRETEEDSASQYTWFRIIYFDTDLKILQFKDDDNILSYIDTQSKLKQIQNKSIFLYWNPFNQVHNRILFGDPNIAGGYIGIENNFGFDSQSYWQQDNSLLYQDQGQVLVIKKLGQFKQDTNSYSLGEDIFITSSQNLGLIIVKKLNQIDFITLDSYELQYSISLNNKTEIFDNKDILPVYEIFWSENFETLIILQNSTIIGYSFSNKFNESVFDYNFNQQEKIWCSLFEINPIFACDKLGFYNYQKKVFIENDKLKVSKLKLGNFKRMIIENDEIIISTLFEYTQIAVYSVKETIFLKNIDLKMYISQLDLYMHPLVKSQIIFINERKRVCGAFSFFTVKLIKVFNDNNCKYIEEIQSLVVFYSNSTAIYKLPFSPNSEPSYLFQNLIYFENKDRIFDLNSTQIYIEKVYPDVIRSSYYKIYIENFITGQISSQIYFLLYDDNLEKYLYWQEKEMYFFQNTFISFSDKKYLWTLSKITRSYEIIGDYFYKYNYIIKRRVQEKKDYTVVEFIETLDISEIFPFNSLQNDLFNQFKVKNINYYYENKEESENDTNYVVTFNTQIQKVIKFYLTQEGENEDLFSVQDYQDINIKEFQLFKDYKTPFKIIYLKDYNSKTKKNIFGINIMCRIIFFEKNKQVNTIDLTQFSCQILQINSVVFLINQNQNKLYQLLYSQELIFKQELSLNIQNNMNINDISTDIQARWILIFLVDNNQNKLNESLLIRNNSENKMDFTIKTTSPISSNHFFEYINKEYLIIGEEDSSITIYLLKFNSNYQDQILQQSKFYSQLLNFHNGSNKLILFHFFKKILGMQIQVNLYTNYWIQNRNKQYIILNLFMIIKLIEEQISQITQNLLQKRYLIVLKGMKIKVVENKSGHPTIL